MHQSNDESIKLLINAKQQLSKTEETACDITENLYTQRDTLIKIQTNTDKSNIEINKGKQTLLKMIQYNKKQIYIIISLIIILIAIIVIVVCYIKNKL